jgi:chloramphenicol 3-O-phosphotransferase
MMTSSFVLALTGAQSSGKTTLARAVSASTGATYIGFGNLVRAEAARRGLGDSRDELQELGQSLLDELGALLFSERTLDAAGAARGARPVVWDGVRHPEVLDALRELYAPAPVTLVTLAPDETARRRRVEALAGSEAELVRWEAHETERHRDWLESQSTFVCRASTPELALAKVMELLGDA